MLSRTLFELRFSTQEGTLMVKAALRLGTVEVTADGEGLVSHAGAALLAEIVARRDG